MVYKVPKIKKSVCKINDLVSNSSFEGKIFWSCIDSLTLVKVCYCGMEYLNRPTSQTQC